MKERLLNSRQLELFTRKLREDERSAGTIENYLWHLFARTFYKVCRDVARLADVLGHSSIETTRIYLISTGVEHARTLELLRLVT